jgi:hypothetical protein
MSAKCACECRSGACPCGLNNAAKYTDPGDKIWLSVEREGEQAVVRVRDSGSATLNSGGPC